MQPTGAVALLEPPDVEPLRVETPAETPAESVGCDGAPRWLGSNEFVAQPAEGLGGTGSMTREVRMGNVGTNPYRDISRERRRRLTASLLSQAAEAGEDRRAELLDEVVLVNLCVARSIAARYSSRGVAREDLEQVASAALVRAVHHFDLGREGDLLSYAVPSIRGELRRHFRDQGWTVRPPRRVQELQSQVVAERDRLTQADDVEGTPSTAEIARRLDVSETDVEEALAAEGCFTPTSLDARVGKDGDASLGDLLTDGDVEEGAEAAEARVMLEPVVRDLPARDRKLLRMRFFEDLTQQEIADEIGVTQTQVSRLLGRILADLRRGVGEVTSQPLGSAADEQE